MPFQLLFLLLLVYRAYSGQPGFVAVFYFEAGTFGLATAAIQGPVTCHSRKHQRLI